MVPSLVPQALRCEYLVNPLGIDAAQPRLSWTVAAEGRARRQSAYQILVATSRQAVLDSRADLWDSGRVASDRTGHVVYQGRALSVGERAWWSVRVWDQDGQQSEIAEPAWWERGLDQQDWHGLWIGFDDWNGVHMSAQPAPGEMHGPVPLAGLIPSPYLRTTLRVDAPVRRARLYATARGLYELRLNGARVGDRLLTPGWTDYDRRIQYQTYDITTMLIAGENALGAILAPGWYAGYGGYDDHCRNYGTRPQLLLECRVEYQDGRVQVMAGDDTWRAAIGPIHYGDLFMGEHYDATADLPGWDQPGYDDRHWEAVDTLPLTALPLVADRAEPVRIVAELAPIAIAEPAPGLYIVDLGQNIAGWVRLRAAGPAGTRIRLRFAEVLTAEGTLYTENLRFARATDTYICAGHGEESYEPRFTFHGFRYVEVTGYPGTLTPEAVIGCVVASDTPWTGSFTCSSALVTQLARNIEWSQRDNFLSIPTDCPQRNERLGWLGDAQVFVGTACYNADVAAFFTKWMADVEDAQSPNGAFPDVAPRIADLSDGAPAWGDAGVIVPWTIYRRYGDTAIIRRHYAAMGRWMDYLLQANPGFMRLGRLNNDFGDWLSVDASTPGDVLATAYWAYDARLMAEMARAIGEDADADRYYDLFSRIRETFIAAYVDGEGHVAGRTQTAYVLALHMDLLPPALRSAAAAHLVADIEERGGHLSTGFVGVGYLCPVLTETGHLDVAYRLLMNETYPSWGYTIREGATTIWERWDGYTAERGFQTPDMNSFNHYSLGSVGEWLYRYVAGIDTDSDAPGYARILIRPYPGGGLTHAEATYRSMRGPIRSAWRLDGGTLSLEVTIPANTTAVVSLPVTRAGDVQEGGLPAAHAEGVISVDRREGGADIAIGSGTYHFTVAWTIG